MNQRDDLVERALGALARREGLEPPDAGLEALLRERHAKRRGGLRRFVLPGLVVASLSGAAYAGGWQLVRRWWFSIEVDGTVTQGTHDGDGERVFHLEPEGGGEATVRVSREGLESGGERTRIELDRAQPGRSDREVAENVVGAAPRESLAADRIEGRPPLFRFDAERGPCAVYLLDEAEPRLVLHRERATPGTVVVLDTLPIDALDDATRFEFEFAPERGLELTLVLADGIERAFAWTIDAAPVRPAGAELQTDDGRIRVRVQNDPDAPRER